MNDTIKPKGAKRKAKRLVLMAAAVLLLLIILPAGLWVQPAYAAFTPGDDPAPLTIVASPHDGKVSFQWKRQSGVEYYVEIWITYRFDVYEHYYFELKTATEIPIPYRPDVDFMQDPEYEYIRVAADMNMFTFLQSPPYNPSSGEWTYDFKNLENGLEHDFAVLGYYDPPGEPVEYYRTAMAGASNVVPTAPAVPAAGFALLNVPEEVEAGQPFSFQIEALNAGGTRETGCIGDRTIIWNWNNATASPGGQAPVTGSTTVHFTAGLAEVSGFTLYRAGETPVLTAQEQSRPETSTGSQPITVHPKNTTSLALEMSVAAFRALPAKITVRARDVYGNTTPAYRETVSFSSTAENAQLPADYQFTGADNGVKVFDAVFNTLGIRTLTVTDGTLTTQRGFSVQTRDVLAGGVVHSVALKADGTIAAWGNNQYGQSNTAGITNVVSVAASDRRTLAVQADGSVLSWGHDAQISGFGGLVVMSAGWGHFLGITPAGAVLANGFNNDYGQLTVPPGLGPVVDVAAGEYHSLALKEDGTVAAWGRNNYGQITVPPFLNNVVAVAAGYNHSLALKEDGTVVAWGRNDLGQCNAPGDLSGVVAIAADGNYSVALKANGTVVEWGPGSDVPGGLIDVVAIAAGQNHRLALKADGAVVAWGSNSFGQATIPAGLNLAGRLSALQISQGALTPAFNPDTAAYTAVVDTGVTSLDITAEMIAAENPGGVLKIGGQTVQSGAPHTLSLDLGKNHIPITIYTPALGMTRTYMLTIDREHLVHSALLEFPGYSGDDIPTGRTIEMKVTMKDGAGETIDDYTGAVNFAVSGPAGGEVSAYGLPASYTFLESDGGVKTFSVTVPQSGEITVTASGTNRDSSPWSGGVTRSVRYFAHTAAASAASGEAAAGAERTINIEVKKADGALDATFSGEKDVTISGYEAAPDGTWGSCNGTPLTGGSSTRSLTFANGAASLGLALHKAGEQDLAFSVAGVDQPQTNALHLSTVPAAPALMTLTRDIAPPEANGGVFAVQPLVELSDSFGNLCVNDSATLVTASKKDGGDWTLTGTKSVAASAGVAVFTDLGARNTPAIAGATLAFDAPGLSQIPSGPVSLPADTVSAQSLVLSLAEPGAAVRAGQPFPVTVEALNLYGERAVSFTGAVSFSADDLAAGLPEAYTFAPADSGVKTFSVILPNAGNYDLTVTGPAENLRDTLNIEVAPVYSVTYEGNGHTGGAAPVDPTAYIAEETVTVLGQGSLVKTDYTFMGWNTRADGEGTLYAAGDAFPIGTAGVTLYAQWELNRYQVSFNSNEGSPVDSQTVSHGGYAVKPAPDPVRAGHTFDGWYADPNFGGEPFAFTTTPVTGPITLHAKWIIHIYTVSFQADGGEPAPEGQAVEYNHYAAEPAAMAREGYHFGGWYLNPDFSGDAFTFATTPVTGPTTLYGQWIINSYEVSFNSNQGSPVSSKMVSHGGYAAKPAPDPEKTGHDFAGWYADPAFGGETFAFATTPITEPITLYAKWTVRIYTVSFDTKGGEPEPDSQSVPYQGKASEPEPEPTKFRHTFAHWYADPDAEDEPFDFSTPIGDDLTLCAKWTANPLYNVSYNGNGQDSGSAPNDSNSPYGAGETVNIAGNTGNLFRRGFSFAGWNSRADGSGTDYPAETTVAMPAEHLTLYAVWQPLVWQGTGSKNDPYLVESAAHLDDMRNKTGGGVYFRQARDISLAGINWQPIAFAGIYQGNGKIIANLTITTKVDYSGLFSHVGADGTLENIQLTNVSLPHIISDAGQKGALAGRNDGIISLSSAAGSIGGPIASKVGGLVGENYGQILNSRSAVNVDGYYGASAGGLAGENYGQIQNCYSAGNEIKGGNTAKVGGLVGRNDATGTIRQSYSGSVVLGGAETVRGGLVGVNDGSAAENVTDSYFDKDMAGTAESAGGTALSAAQMKKQESFVNWDFLTTWSIVQDVSTPKLQWQALTHSVTYAPNGGEGPAPEESDKAAGESFTAEANSFTPPAGKLFVEWNTRPDGTGDSYAPGDGITMPLHNLVLYAVWKQYIFTVTYDANGGSGPAPEESDIAAGDIFTAAAGSFIPPEGMTFKEWNTRPDGTGDSYAPGDEITMPPNNLVLYALWDFVLEGDGSAGNPYRISSAEHLNDIRTKGLGVHYIQTADIDLEGMEWIPLGTSSAPFTGHYNGGGFTVGNLHIDRPQDDDVGLFGVVGDGAVIENLHIINATVRGGEINAGILAGTISGSGVITNCSVGGDVVSYAKRIGGLAGSIYHENALIAGSFSTAKVETSGNITIGGFVGLILNGTVRDSYASGEVTGEQFLGIGNVGGFAGRINSGVVERCYAAGNVSGMHRGGFIYSNISGVVRDCFYDFESTGVSSSGAGTAKSTAQMKQLLTFTGWDFANTWKIGEGVSYPTLLWQPWTADEAITADWDALTWGVIKGLNTDMDNVKTDLALPVDGGNGSSIFWSVSPEGWINPETGEVTRPADANKTVTLTAAVSKEGGVSRSKEFILTVTAPYTLTYEPNGGSGTAVVEGGRVAGETFTIAGADTFETPVGKHFVEWNTQADGTGTGYAAGAETSMPAQNLTLYAIWANNVYTVNYEANGGGGTSPVVISKAFGETFAAAGSDTFEAPVGKHFVEWNTESDRTGTAYTAGTVITMPAQDLALYAIWEDTVYTLNYNANGGSGTPPAESQMIYGASFTVAAAETFTAPIGKHFVEWNTQDDGTGTGYAAGAETSMPAQNLTLYAIWENNVYTLSYYANDGSGTPPVESDKAYDTTFSAAEANTFTAPTGKGFVEWNTQSDGGGESYAAGAQITMPLHDLTLYAIWEDTVYTLNYDANGGSGTPPAESQMIYGAPFTVAAADTFSAPLEKRFKEWNTRSDGEGEGFAAGEEISMPAQDLTLYAIWGDTIYTLSYHANGGGGTPPPPANITVDETFTIAGADTFASPLGMQFKEWNELADGTGIGYAAGEEISMPARNLTLYAIWEDLVWEGNGDQDTPYLVESAAHLNAVRTMASSGKYFRQTGDISLAGYADWEPIGTMASPFTGHYDGLGHTVSHLTVNKTGNDYVGFFGYVSGGATITDLHIINANVNGHLYVGILVGTISNGGAAIENCSAGGTVTGRAYVGGLIGRLDHRDALVTGSYSTATVKANGPSYDLVAGGLVSRVSAGATVRDSYASGSVEGGHAGGLVGSKGDGTIERCYATGKVTGTTPGGLVGVNSGAPANASFYDYLTTEQINSAGGTGKDTAAMMTMTTFSNAGWNFDTTWSINEGVSYPTLKWQLPKTADEEIIADLNALSWNAIKGANTAVNNVKTGLNLPTEGVYGTTIAWSVSPDEGWINPETGAVTRPADANKTVTLTAAVSKEGGVSQTKDFVLTVTVPYSLTYEPNGGSGSALVDGGRAEGETFAAAVADTFTAPQGKAFKAWNTKADGTGDSYPAGASITMPAHNLTLYAVWRTPLFTLNYSANEGSGTPPAESMTAFDETFVAAAADTFMAPSGKQFKEWNTQANGNGTSYAAGAEISMPAQNLTLYAIWEGLVWQGNGSEGTPYLVESAAHLNAIRTMASSKKHFQQTRDISLAGYANWESIGTYDAPFNGVYDGAGYSIRNLMINKPGANGVGLFNVLAGGGVLRDVHVENANVTGWVNAGILAGAILGDSGSIRQGGGIIEDCSVSGNVTTTGGKVGGLLGGMETADARISRSFSAAAVYTQETDTGFYGAGGVVGYLGAGTISDSYASGPVQGKRAGGLVGRMTGGTVDNSYAAGKVTGAGGYDVTGGLVGERSGGSVTDSFFDQQTTEQTSSAGGTGKNTVDMKVKSTFTDAGWVFTPDTGVWRMIQGYTYPLLQWQGLTADERIILDWQALDWADIAGENSEEDNVATALNLFTTGDNGAAITWSAEPGNYINLTTGAVTRPAGGDTEVALTAMVSYPGGTTRTKVFNLTILRKNITIAGITPVGDVSVAYGTEVAEAIAALAGATTITDSESNTHAVGLSWSIPGYDGTIPGNYTAAGTFTLPEGINQTEPATQLKVEATVTVEAEPVNPGISPATVSFDLAAPAGISITITWGSTATSVAEVVYGSGTLVLDTDYTINENTLTIKKEYLESLNLTEGTAAEFEIRFNDGAVLTLTVDAVNNYIPSGNANLSGLTLSAGVLDPEFDPEVTGYTAEVSSGTGSVNVTPVLADSHAEVTVNGTLVTGGNAISVALATGNNTVGIVVTAENGTVKTYTVIINRAAPATYTVAISSAVNGNATGGGTYAAGAGVTLSASPNAGYNFDGWYDGGTKVSSLPNYTFTMTEDITLTPAFVPMQKRGLAISPSGNGFVKLNINQSDRSDITAFYKVDHEWGSSIRLTAVPNAGYTFAYWMDGSTSSIISTDPVYEFVMGAGINIHAIFCQDPETASSFLVVFRDKSGKILQSEEVGTGQSTTAPNIPSIAGYNFVGWDKEFNTITSHMAINAVYARKPGFYTVTVENGTLSTGGATGDYQYDMPVTVTAGTVPGKKFSHWEKNGQKVSVETTYTFFVPVTDTTIRAVFAENDAVIVNTPFITLSHIVMVENNNMTYTAYRSVPQGYTLLESGVVILKAAGLSGELTLDTAGSLRGRIKNDSTDQFYMRKTNVQAGEKWHARAYLIYQDAGGNIITVYSEETVTTAIN